MLTSLYAVFEYDAFFFSAAAAVLQCDIAEKEGEYEQLQHISESKEVEYVKLGTVLQSQLAESKEETIVARENTQAAELRADAIATKAALGKAKLESELSTLRQQYVH